MIPRQITLPAVGGVVKTPRASTANPLPFAPIPVAILTDRRLTPRCVQLVGVLLSYARQDRSCWPAVATLASDLGCCVRTVQYALRRLEAAGWIRTEPAGNPTGRRIVLTWRDVAPPPVQAPYSQGLPRPAGGATGPKPVQIPEKETKTWVASRPKNPEDPDAAALARFTALPEPDRAFWRAEAVRRWGWCRKAPRVVELLAAGLVPPG